MFPRCLHRNGFAQKIPASPVGEGLAPPVCKHKIRCISRDAEDVDPYKIGGDLRKKMCVTSNFTCTYGRSKPLPYR